MTSKRTAERLKSKLAVLDILQQGRELVRYVRKHVRRPLQAATFTWSMAGIPLVLHKEHLLPRLQKDKEKT